MEEHGGRGDERVLLREEREPEQRQGRPRSRDRPPVQDDGEAGQREEDGGGVDAGQGGPGGHEPGHHEGEGQGERRPRRPEQPTQRDEQDRQEPEQRQEGEEAREEERRSQGFLPQRHEGDVDRRIVRDEEGVVGEIGEVVAARGQELGHGQGAALTVVAAPGRAQDGEGLRDEHPRSVGEHGREGDRREPLQSRRHRRSPAGLRPRRRPARPSI